MKTTRERNKRLLKRSLKRTGVLLQPNTLEDSKWLSSLWHNKNLELGIGTPYAFFDLVFFSYYDEEDDDVFFSVRVDVKKVADKNFTKNIVRVLLDNLVVYFFLISDEDFDLFKAISNDVRMPKKYPLSCYELAYDLIIEYIPDWELADMLPNPYHYDFDDIQIYSYANK